MTNDKLRVYQILDKEDEVVAEVHAFGMGDEYHTMHELYQHRMALTVALTKLIDNTSDWHSLEAYRSKNHHPDGNPMFEGYFIVWISKDNKMIISYHYDLKHWDDFKHLMELEYSPKWDGHSSKDVLERLMKL